MDARLRGNGLRDLGLCQRIVEREKFNGVVMITTIWGRVDLGQTRDRECEHYDTLQFWSDLCCLAPLCRVNLRKANHCVYCKLQ